MLASTFSTASASGNSGAWTSSGETQPLVDETVACAGLVCVESDGGGADDDVEEEVVVLCRTASRSRTTVKAENMSPVPVKGQSIAGKSILKIRAL